MQNMLNSIYKLDKYTPCASPHLRFYTKIGFKFVAHGFQHSVLFGFLFAIIYHIHYEITKDISEQIIIENTD